MSVEEQTELDNSVVYASLVHTLSTAAAADGLSSPLLDAPAAGGDYKSMHMSTSRTLGDKGQPQGPSTTVPKYCFRFCDDTESYHRLRMVLAPFLQLWEWGGLEGPRDIVRPGSAKRRVFLWFLWLLTLYVLSITLYATANDSPSVSATMGHISQMTVDITSLCSTISVLLWGPRMGLWSLARFVLSAVGGDQQRFLSLVVKRMVWIGVFVSVGIFLITVLQAPVFFRAAPQESTFFTMLGFGVNTGLGVVILFIFAFCGVVVVLMTSVAFSCVVLYVTLHSALVRSFAQSLYEWNRQRGQQGKHSQPRSPPTDCVSASHDLFSLADIYGHHRVLCSLLSRSSRSLRGAVAALLAGYSALTLVYFFVLLSNVGDSRVLLTNAVSFTLAGSLCVALLHVLSLPWRDFAKLHTVASHMDNLPPAERLALVLYFKANTNGWHVFGSVITNTIELRVLYGLATVLVFILQRTAFG